MQDIFGTSKVIEEARSVAKARAAEGKKPGQNLFLILLGTLAIFLISNSISTIVSIIYLLSGNLNSGGNMEEMLENLKSASLSGPVLYLSLYLTVITIILSILYAKIFEKRKITSLGFVKKKMLPTYLLGVVLAIVLMAAAAGFCLVTGAMSIKLEGMGVGSFIIFVGCWLVQGLSEEVMCRGLLMTSISRRYPVGVGIIVNSIVFALCHIANPGLTVLAFINLILFGVFMSLLFLKTDCIWACAGCHSVWNLIQGNVLGIPVSGMSITTIFATKFNNNLGLLNGGDFGLEGGLGVTLVLLIVCSILFIMLKKRNAKAA